MDVMMRLKGAGFSAIANAFREREQRLGGGLPLLDFVEIVQRGLPRPATAEDKATNVSALVDLFEDIDINGDGVMEFDEFTSFCVDAGMVANRTQAATLKHRYVRDVRHALKTSAAAAPLSKPSQGISSSNSPSSSTPRSSESVEKLKWSPELGHFLVLENVARSVKVFAADGTFVAEVGVATEQQPQTQGGGAGDVVLDVGDGVAFVAASSSPPTPSTASSVFILDAVFIHRFHWLATSTTDFAISFYDMSEPRQRLPSSSTANTSSAPSFELLPKLTLATASAQLLLRFCEASALLIGSGNDCVLTVWKILDAETKVLWKRLAAHTDLVLDVLEIPPHDLLVSCDLKRNLQLWDVTNGRQRGALVGHTRGVRQLCYSAQHDLLLSASFEFEALAWDVSSRQVALKLAGHRAPLVGIQLALFQTERAITADCQGVFKVWDISRGHAASSGVGGGSGVASLAIQLESVDLALPFARVEPTAFVSLHPLRRDLWVATAGSSTLQRLRSARVQQLDELPLRAFYAAAANQFVVVASSVCSLWDGETGACTDEFSHVGSFGLTAKADDAAGPIKTPSTRREPGTELLACVQDVKAKKLVVVSETGALGVFNCLNMVQMRRCPESFLPKRAHRSVGAVAPSNGIVDLHYCSENKLIIMTDAATRAIVVLDDSSNHTSAKGAKEIVVLRRLVNLPGGIGASAYGFHASMVATAEPNSMTVSLWDFETLAFVADCRYDDETGGSSSAMQVLAFWDEFPVLLGADLLGGVYFFAVTPLLHATPGQLLHAFANDQAHGGQAAATSVSSEPPEAANEAGKQQKEAEDGENNARKLLLRSIHARKNARAINKPPLVTAAAVTCLKMVFDEQNERFLLFTGDEDGCVSVWDPAAMMQRLALAKIPEIKCKHLRRGYHPKAMFARDFAKEASTGGKSPSNQPQKHRQAVSDGSSGADWRAAMLLGEDMEHMNVRASQTDLKRLSRRRVELRKPPRSTGKALDPQSLRNPPFAGAKPKETAVVNAVAAVEYLLGKGSTSPPPNPKASKVGKTTPCSGSKCFEKFPKDVALVRRWQAHNDALTSLEVSHRPDILVTCALDLRVFVWDWHGACLGKLFDPENRGPWTWRFRKDDARRTQERELVVQELLRELDRSPHEKIEQRRQTLYAEHVGHRSVGDLRNVNTMLLEHIVSKNPELALLERELQKAGASETAGNGSKPSRVRGKTGALQVLALLPPSKAKKPASVQPSAKTLRLQSLNQVGPLLRVANVPSKTAPSSEPLAFSESADLKMDKAYMEQELAITCPSSSVLKGGKQTVEAQQQQLRTVFEAAQQTVASRVTLERKAREMYANFEGVRGRHQPSASSSSVSVDTGNIMEDLLTPSDFLKRHLPASALTTRPQTAPMRVLSGSSSAGHVGPLKQLRTAEKAARIARKQGLQTSASASTLPVNETFRTGWQRPNNPVNGSGNNRKNSLDMVYMEESQRHHQPTHHEGDAELEAASDGDKPPPKPLQKLRGINEIIAKAQHYCNSTSNSGGQGQRQTLRPGTAPIGASRGTSMPLTMATLTEEGGRPSTQLEASDSSIDQEREASKSQETETLRRHMEDTKQRMQMAMQDGERALHRQNLRKLRHQTQQQQQKRRMEGYLQQKRRELTTNIGNVFKGLQTGYANAEEGKAVQSTSSKTSKLKPKATGESPTKKAFGIYSVREVMSVLRLFWSMDVDGSGSLSMTELQQYTPFFEKLGYHDLASVFQAIDSDGDGQLSLRELLEICFHFATKVQLEAMLQLAKVGSSASGASSQSVDAILSGASTSNLQVEQRRELLAIFRVFDHNGDGGVSMQEIMEALRVDDDDVMAAVMTREHERADRGHASRAAGPVVASGITREDVEQLYREFDADQDATLDFDEFVAVMQSLYASKPLHA
ncbi:hypothetical protein BBJ28_00009321 [Nothophytophthora sp. Chile5]|nr:hypothetical protein BBJ28_00009321 [Nothophytophthora sp. Chile5]